MAPISLKIISNDGAVTRKVKFDSKSTVRDAHALIKEKVLVADDTKEHGLFLRSPDDDRKGIWLENHRTLDYYMLRDGDSLEYICKIRNLRVKLLDGTVKILQVDEGKTISELMVNICARFNIANHDEHGLCPEEEEKPEEAKELPQAGTLTKRRRVQPKERDVTLEQLSKKFNTDDHVHWLDAHSTLRELGVAGARTLVLKRRLFFSDRNVDARDPVQLSVLFVQTRDAILAGRHLVPEPQAADCKVRWINIRDVYRRILRKSLRSGSRPCRAYKYEKEITFMRNCYKDVTAAAVNCTDDEKVNDWSDAVDDNVDGDDNDAPAASYFSEDSEKPIKVRNKKIKTKRKKAKKIKEVLYEEEEKQASSTFNETTPAISGDFDMTDPVDAFLLSIGATLKTFSPYHLNVAKSKIFAVVQEHDLQQIVQKQQHDQVDVKASASGQSGIYLG